MQYDFMVTNKGWIEKAFLAKDKKQYWNEWQNRYEKIDPDLKFEDFGFTPKLSDLDRLPSLSFMLRIPFKLRKPYLSKDDRTFHLLENSVHKDKVFQTPMVAPTGWKGALRATFWQLGHQENSEQIIRLFGNEREEEDHKKLKSGQLYFYPTFFDKIELEVINPHDRKTGIGKTGPIFLECVPANATGEFILLYVPFGAVKSEEVAADLKLVVEGIQAMLTVYGFGAKTSSGFGVVDIQGKGEFAIRADLPARCNNPLRLKQKTDFLNEEGSLKQEFLNDDDGSFKTEKQYKTFLKSQGKTHESKLYRKAKQWWEDNMGELVPESKPLQPITKVFFTGCNELCERVQIMVAQLSSRGEA
jgi:CRISPR-associated protein Cmr2